MDPIKELVARFDYLESRRDNWDTHYQELADYMLPRKADVVKKRSRGEKRMELIYDGTALQAVDLLSASLHGMLTSGATPWFHLAMKDPDIGRDDMVQRWLEDSSKRMIRAFNQSNFETEVHELYVDLVVFGTGCMFVEMDGENLRFLAHATSLSFMLRKTSLAWSILCSVSTRSLHGKLCNALGWIT